MAQTQSKSLPARPNLQYLRKLAKQRLKAERVRTGARQDAARLAEVQLAIAREYGFASWRKLKGHVEQAQRQVSPATPAIPDDLVGQFLDLSVPPSDQDHRGGRLERAAQLLQEHPRLAEANVYTAAVTGNARALAELVKQDPPIANKPGGIRSWPPLCYLTFSRFLRLEKKKRSRHFVQAAKVLLDAGADPNSFFPSNPDSLVFERETPLYGACGVANDASLTRLLLERGAHPTNPPDNESLYHATEFSDHACLKLLLDRIPNNAWFNYCMCHMMDREDPAGLKLFLDRGGDANFLMDAGIFRGFRALHFAINRHRSGKIISMLLRAGADPNVPDSNGVKPYVLACRLGHTEAARLLRKHGADDALTDHQQAIRAIMSGDAARVRRLIKDPTAFQASLSDEDRWLFPHAAGEGNVRAVRLMLDLGSNPDLAADWGPALHQAAWSGHLPVVKLLLQRGARLDTLNKYGGDALRAAIHGAVHAGHRNGAKVVTMLAAAMKGSNFSSYLDQAKSEGADEIVRILESAGEKARKRAPARGGKSQWKPIMDAALHGDAERVLALLDQGADPNVLSPAPHLYRPLHRAIEHKKTMPRHAGHERVVELLLQHGANPKLRATRTHMTALQLAAMGEPRFVRLLRKHFEPLDIFHAALLADEQRVVHLLAEDRSLAKARDGEGFTPLLCCAASAMYRQGPGESDALLRIARMLLDSGADSNEAFLFEKKWPLPVLYFACGQQNNPALTELLLRAGANPQDGESVYHASDEGHAECLALLEQYMDPRKLAEECTRSLNTQLHWGRARGMKWLLAHGADPNWVHPQRKTTAIQEAARMFRGKRVVQVLRDHVRGRKRRIAT